MRILGIDPALNSLGWGIIQQDHHKIYYIASGTVKTKPSKAMQYRLADIYHEIESIINQYQPKVIVMEQTFVNNNAVSSMKLGFVRGAIMALVGKQDLSFYEYKPNTIKKTLTGVGHAEKQQVKHMLSLVISSLPAVDNLDESDALAVAYTGLVLLPSLSR
jgi:crossover junction endodeoxyribonuclease RuvC